MWGSDLSSSTPQTKILYLVCKEGEVRFGGGGGWRQLRDGDEDGGGGGYLYACVRVCLCVCIDWHHYSDAWKLRGEKGKTFVLVAYFTFA